MVSVLVKCSYGVALRSVPHEIDWIVLWTVAECFWIDIMLVRLLGNKLAIPGRESVQKMVWIILSPIMNRKCMWSDLFINKVIKCPSNELKWQRCPYLILLFLIEFHITIQVVTLSEKLLWNNHRQPVEDVKLDIFPQGIIQGSRVRKVTYSFFAGNLLKSALAALRGPGVSEGYIDFFSFSEAWLLWNRPDPNV